MLATRPLRFLLLAAFAISVITLLSGYGPAGSLSWLSTFSVLGHDVARLSLREHMRLAEKIWTKTVEQRHNLLAEWRYPENMPLFPADSPKKYPGSPYSIWDFVPASWSCPYEMERIGRMGDGGKWVCGMSKYEELPATRPCVIYSFGVQTESSYGKSTHYGSMGPRRMLTRLLYI
ncbi:hypothetical protein VE02_06567 [Pseudogymnoascus sp. 03VT05]|nr:hypothetical protein VE02_06567 [Pseudogymnoascus sp. 03VT05]